MRCTIAQRSSPASISETSGPLETVFNHFPRTASPTSENSLLLTGAKIHPGLRRVNI
jgi:hypothetical protein